MSRPPLELTIYPPAPPRPTGTGRDVGAWAESRHYEWNVRLAKRLKATELAAEYWRLRLKVCIAGNEDMKTKGHVCAKWQAAHDELDTMMRFMELPHYDQEQQ